MTCPAQTSEIDVYQAIVDLARAGTPFALAVVLEASGSTPRKAGAKAILLADGSIRGTIGGGAVEAEAQRRAGQVIRAGRAVVFEFVFEGLSADGEQPICGGRMRILLDPNASAARDACEAAQAARRQRRRGVLLTGVRLAPQASQGEMPCDVSVRWIASEELAGEPDDSDLAQAARSVLSDQAPRLLTTEHAAVLIEPVSPAPLLVIAGGGHVGQALAAQACLVGFDILVLDDRPEFADPALFPAGAQTCCGDVPAELERRELTGDTYVVIVTRGHLDDQRALAACVGGPAGYVGLIGSRRKIAMIRHNLEESGAATRQQLDRVYAPIGLDIGAQTVPEIAASIVAQLIAVRRGKAGNVPCFS